MGPGESSIEGFNQSDRSKAREPEREVCKEDIHHTITIGANRTTRTITLLSIGCRLGNLFHIPCITTIARGGNHDRERQGIAMRVTAVSGTTYIDISKEWTGGGI